MKNIQDLIHDFLKKYSLIEISIIFFMVILNHIMLLNYIIPLKIFGKSVWLMGSMGSLLVIVLFTFQDRQKKEHKELFFFTVFLTLLTIFLRQEFLGINLVNELFYYRSPIILTLFFVFFFGLKNNLKFQRLGCQIIFAMGAFEGIFGILHKYLFPYIVTGTFAYYRGLYFYIDRIHGAELYSRESGLLGNPGYYADLICLSSFIWIYFLKDSRNLKYGNIFKILVGIILILGVLPSMCRLQIFFTIFFLMFSFTTEENILIFIRTKWYKILALVLSIILLCLILYPQLIERFLKQGNFERWQKNELLFNGLVSSWKFFCFGMPLDLKLSLRSYEGFAFSDNSFLLLISNFGFIFFVVWISYFYKKINSFISYKLTFLISMLTAYCFLNFYLLDTILAEGWCFMLIFVFYSINCKYINCNSKIKN